MIVYKKLLLFLFLLFSLNLWAGPEFPAFVLQPGYIKTLLDAYPEKLPDASFMTGIEIEGYYLGVQESKYKELVKLSESFLAEQGIEVLPYSGTSVEVRNGERFNLGDYRGVTYWAPTPKGLQKEYSIAFKPDITIAYAPGTKPLEINSAIMESQKDLDLFLELFQEIVKTYDFTAEPIHSATQVHQNFKDPHASEVALLTVIFQAIEPKLSKIFNVASDRKAIFARSFSEKELRNFLIAVKSDRMGLYKLLATSGVVKDKTYAINWASYVHLNTVEFRLFNSTASPRVIRGAVDFLEKLVKAIRTKDAKLVAYLLSVSDVSKITFNGIAGAIDAHLANLEVQRDIFRITRAELDYSERIDSELILPKNLDLETPVRLGRDSRPPRSFDLANYSDFLSIIEEDSILSPTCTRWNRNRLGRDQ